MVYYCIMFTEKYNTLLLFSKIVTFRLFEYLRIDEFEYNFQSIREFTDISIYFNLIELSNSDSVNILQTDIHSHVLI